MRRSCGTVLAFSLLASCQGVEGNAILVFDGGTDGSGGGDDASLADAAAAYDSGAWDADDSASQDATFPDAPLPRRRWVAYLADQIVDERDELFLGAPDGATPLQVNAPLETAEDVTTFEWAPHGNALAYKTTGDRVFIVSIDDRGAATPVLIGGGPDASTDPPRTKHATFRGWSYDGRFAAYTEVSGTDSHDLWVWDATTGLRSRVNLDLPPSSTGLGIEAEAWSPVANKLIYRARQVADEDAHVYLVDVTSGTPTVPQRLTTANDVTYSGMGWSPGGGYVWILMDALLPTRVDFFLVSVAGVLPGVPVRIDHGSVASNDVKSFRWFQDSGPILLLTTTADGPQLLRGWPGASEPATVVSLRRGEFVEFAPSGTRFAYTATEEATGTLELRAQTTTAHDLGVSELLGPGTGVVETPTWGPGDGLVFVQDRDPISDDHRSLVFVDVGPWPPAAARVVIDGSDGMVPVEPVWGAGFGSLVYQWYVGGVGEFRRLADPRAASTPAPMGPSFARADLVSGGSRHNRQRVDGTEMLLVRGELDEPGFIDLWAIEPATGTTGTRVNARLVNGGGVLDFAVRP